MRNSTKFALITAAVVTVIAPAGVAVAAPKQAVTTLPVAYPDDITATAAHVFIGGGIGTGEVIVTNAAGKVTGALAGLPADPSALQLSADRKTLYVALPAADTIAAFDTTTLLQTAAYPTGAGTCPTTLALGGRYLWFGYGCEGSDDNNIGHLDLKPKVPVVTLGLNGTQTYLDAAPLVATASGNAKVLLAGLPGMSPAQQWTYQVDANGTLTRLSPGNEESDVSNLQDFALDPTGTTAYIADGAPYYVSAHPVTNLNTPGTTYDTGAYPDAVAVSPDGTHVAGGASDSLNLDVFNIDGTVAAGFPLDGDQQVVEGGLAWAPNGKTLYALVNDGVSDGAPAQLLVLPLGTN